MRIPVGRTWIVASALAILVTIVAAIYFIGEHRVSNASEMLAFLPADNAVMVYVDVGAIRRSGLLNIIAGTKAPEDTEYRQFVDQTKFDYQKDLDAVAAAFKDGQVFLVVRGRFHWKNLADYARAQGGSCRSEYCAVSGSQPGRRISFYPVKTDLLGMAVGPDDFAAYQVTRQAGRHAFIPPAEPAWALIPAAELKQPVPLPVGAKAFASALQNAQEALFTIGPERDHLRLAVRITCRDASAASVLLSNLQNTTTTLRKWIAREHQQANPSDLSGILVGGTFQREDRVVEGRWPVPQAFLQAVTSGSF